MRFPSLLVLGLFAPLLVPSASAQDLVTPVSHSGSTSASTASVDYRYTRGGSPRTGYYWYWRQYTDQGSSAGSPFALNSDSGIQLALGTFYSPYYGAIAYGMDRFATDAVSADYTVLVATETVLDPALAAHQGASVSARVDDSFVFTVDVGIDVTLDDGGLGGSIVLVDMFANETVLAGSQGQSVTASIDPGTYRVSTLLMASAEHNTQTGISTNTGTNVQFLLAHLHIVPSN